MYEGGEVGEIVRIALVPVKKLIKSWTYMLPREERQNPLSPLFPVGAIAVYQDYGWQPIA